MLLMTVDRPVGLPLVRRHTAALSDEIDRKAGKSCSLIIVLLTMMNNLSESQNGSSVMAIKQFDGLIIVKKSCGYKV